MHIHVHRHKHKHLFCYHKQMYTNGEPADDRDAHKTIWGDVVLKAVELPSAADLESGEASAAPAPSTGNQAAAPPQPKRRRRR